MLKTNENCLVIFEGKLTLGILIKKIKTSWEVALDTKPQHTRIIVNKSCIIPYSVENLKYNGSILHTFIALEHNLENKLAN